jgi:hypothetical protein
MKHYNAMQTDQISVVESQKEKEQHKRNLLILGLMSPSSLADILKPLGLSKKLNHSVDIFQFIVMTCFMFKILVI